MCDGSIADVSRPRLHAHRHPESCLCGGVKLTFPPLLTLFLSSTRDKYGKYPNCRNVAAAFSLRDTGRCFCGGLLHAANHTQLWIIKCYLQQSLEIFLLFFSHPCAQKRVLAFHCQPGICSRPCLAFTVGSWWDCGHKKNRSWGGMTAFLPSQHPCDPPPKKRQPPEFPHGSARVHAHIKQNGEIDVYVCVCVWPCRLPLQHNKLPALSNLLCVLCKREKGSLTVLNLCTYVISPWVNKTHCPHGLNVMIWENNTATHCNNWGILFLYFLPRQTAN